MTAVICAIAKNENNYINDWVNYHLALGFDHIYLFDNNDTSTPDVKNFIEALEKVTIINVNNIHENMFQIKCYNDFYNQYKKSFDWCAIIDIDEFIELENYTSIKDFLAQDIFKNFNAIRLNWHLFGDDNLIFRNMNEPVFNAFHNRIYKLPLEGKSIIRGNLELKFTSNHYAINVDDTLPVTACYADGKSCLEKVFLSEDHAGAWCNHYMTKTIIEFLAQKLNRGDACFDKRQITLDYFWKINTKTPEKLSAINWYNQFVINYWSPATKDIDNVGDIITKYLFELMGFASKYKANADVIGAGSILSFNQLKNTAPLVWGSGFIDGRQALALKTLPANFFSVRGNLTKQKLKLKNCTIGDPGLLISKYYRPKINKKYKFGIITHFTDNKTFTNWFNNDSNYHIINTFIPNDLKSVKKFFDELNACEFIFSSSLHGIIFAHAYGIPALHIKNMKNQFINNANVISPDQFKFKDYYSALNIEYTFEPIATKEDVIAVVNKYIEQQANWDKYIPTNINTIQKDIQTAWNNLIFTLYKKQFKQYLTTSRQCWLFYLSSNNYYIYLLLGAYKNLLDSATKFPIYCAVTEEVNKKTRDLLTKIGLNIIDLDTTTVKQASFSKDNKSWWLQAITKLAILDTSIEQQFDKIIYLDTDLWIRNNIDELMQKPHMTAVFDRSPATDRNLSVYEPGKSIFCSGLFVWDFKNNPGKGHKLLQSLSNLPEKIEWHDQSVLNYWYPKWKDSPNLQLDFNYGLMNWDDIISYIHDEQKLANVKIIHITNRLRDGWPFTKQIHAPKYSWYFKEWIQNLADATNYFNTKYDLNLPVIHAENILPVIKEIKKEEEKKKDIRADGQPNAFLYF